MKTQLSRWLLLGALLAASASVPSAQAATPARADLILVNGVVLTEDAADRTAEAIAVRGGRILAVGTTAEVRALADRHTREIDLRGRTVTPGLIDSHAHLLEGGLNTVLTVDLSDANSIEVVRERVRQRAKTLRPGQWLLGSGWDEAKFREGRYPHASDLDDVAPSNPVWLVHTTGHYGVGNSQALHAGNIVKATIDPPASTIDRDISGEPTGVLKEEAAMALIESHIPEPTAADLRRGLLVGLELLHSEGMTAVKDPNLMPAQWQAYLGLARAGKLTAHVCALLHSAPSLEAARTLATRLKSLPSPPSTVAPNLVACGVKMFMDGSGGGRTAWMYDDWNRERLNVDTGNKGYPALDPVLYRTIVRLYNDAGIHVATHAIGDRAIDWVVDSYSEALASKPTHGLRHAIIHANTPTDHAIDVMARLQKDYDAGYPEAQAPFAWWIGDNYAGNLGAGRSQRLNPFATYLEKGIRWGGGSDYSVTPLPARFGLWASVERRTLNGTYGPQPFGTKEAVPATIALRSYTTWAAHQLFLDNEAGSLEAGKSADLAVWDDNPLAVDPARLRDLHCLMTVFRGEVVFRAKDAAERLGESPRAAHR
jgi:predicted amidohydrolase YtcJ